MDQDEASLKIRQLIEELIKTSNEDRDRSLTTYRFIKDMIEENEMSAPLNTSGDENIIQNEVAQMYNKNKRRSSGSLLEQLNKSLELSIKSNDNMVKIVDILSKLKNSKSKEGGSTEELMSSLRTFIINEVKKPNKPIKK